MTKKAITIITILCLLLTACGQSSQEEEQKTTVAGQTAEDETQGEEPQEEEEMYWVLEELALPDADTAMADVIPEDGEKGSFRWLFINGTIYKYAYVWNADGEEVGCCVQKLDPPYVEWVNYFIGSEDWVEGESCKVSRLIATDSGLNALLSGDENVYIGEWTEEGASVVGTGNDTVEKYLETMLTELYFDWWRGQDGSVFLYDVNQYIHIGDDLETIDMLTREGGYLIDAVVENKYDGNFYLICPEEFEYEEYGEGLDAQTTLTIRGLRILTSDGEKELVYSPDVSTLFSIVYFISQTEGYLYNSGGVYNFSIEEGTIDLQYNAFEDAYIWNKIIEGGYAKEDGTHVLLTADGDGTHQLVKLRKERGQTADTQKQVLEWATISPNSVTQRAVTAFNKQSENYKIVLRLPNEGETTRDFRNRIQAEVSGGGGPDLLSEGLVIDAEAGARRGFLADLTEYFAEYEDEVLPSAWKLGVVNDRRYAVPYSCAVTTVVTDGRLVEGHDKWTLEEAMEYMEQSDAQYFMAGADEALLFYYMGLQTETNDQLVDWENGISHLDSDTAVKLLEFVSRYADHEYEHGDESKSMEVAEGKAMTAIFYLMFPDSMKLPAAMFENHEVYIGFPTENGESGHYIYGDSLAVNQSSASVEGAVEFIRFLLSEETQTDMADSVIRNSVMRYPVRNSAMDQVYDYLQEDQGESGGVSTIDGLELEAGPLSDENIRKLRELIETARPMGRRAEQLLNVIEEEITGFQSSGKSAKQVLDIINNRAQLYLDETGFFQP